MQLNPPGMLGNSDSFHLYELQKAKDEGHQEASPCLFVFLLISKFAGRFSPPPLLRCN